MDGGRQKKSLMISCLIKLKKDLFKCVSVLLRMHKTENEQNTILFNFLLFLLYSEVRNRIKIRNIIVVGDLQGESLPFVIPLCF